MLYIIFTALLCFLGIFTFIPKFKSVIERHDVGINFFLTLIATLVGVLLAISFTNYEAEQKEKHDVIKLLNSSISSVKTCYEYSEELSEFFNSLPEEDSLRDEFYIKNPPPYPDYLDTFLMQNIVSKNLSGTTLSELNEYLINLKRSRTFNAPLYLKVLEQTLKLLELEVAFQKDIISEVQLDAEISELNDILTSSY
ncbi:hypothetical protein MTsDn1_27770 [Alteromonas sp. MTD1]|jgi:hypothetical protein|uniref:hypothetical protein n=1 Tax=Alteromonas sp. MTD1 TaxID=3057962 RepID=UPI0036F335D1